MMVNIKQTNIWMYVHHKRAIGQTDILLALDLECR